MAYVDIMGPIDDRRLDMNTALLRMDTYNVNRGRSAAKTNPSEFLIKFKSRQTKENWQHNKNMAYLIAGALAGKQ